MHAESRWWPWMRLEQVKASLSFGAAAKRPHSLLNGTRHRQIAQLSGSSIPMRMSFRSSRFVSPNALKHEHMLIARVIGNVVATQKNQRYEGTRAMLCRQITPEGEDMEYTCIALDSVNSGEGDIVIIAQEGWSASTAATGRPGAAIDSAIVGVVDYVDLLAKDPSAG